MDSSVIIHTVLDSSFTEKESEYFMELASPIRLEILKRLLKKELRMRDIASLIGCTPQEVNRNLRRLQSVGLVVKSVNNTYKITNMGLILSNHFSLVSCLVKNRRYFDTHDVSCLGIKFLMRLGVLVNCKKVTGICNVLDVWQSIYKNANFFICDMVSEYPSNLFTPLVERLHDGVKYRHIIARDIIGQERYEATLRDLGYYEFFEKGLVEQKTAKVDTMVVLNEKEAGIMFNSQEGYVDMRVMFYGKEPSFHEFCLDVFEKVWREFGQAKGTAIQYERGSI